MGRYGHGLLQIPSNFQVPAKILTHLGDWVSKDFPALEISDDKV
jgi:hypothetical protein